MIYKQIVTVIALWVITATAAWAQFDHTHAAWSTLLKKHVVVINSGKASRMRYAGMAVDRAQLKSYLDSLAAASEVRSASSG